MDKTCPSADLESSLFPASGNLELVDPPVEPSSSEGSVLTWSPARTPDNSE